MVKIQFTRRFTSISIEIVIISSLPRGKNTRKLFPRRRKFLQNLGTILLPGLITKAGIFVVLGIIARLLNKRMYKEIL